MSDNFDKTLSQNESGEFYTLEDYMAMLPETLRTLPARLSCIISCDRASLESVRKMYHMEDCDSVVLLTMDTAKKNLARCELYIGSPENLLHEMGHVLDAMGGNGMDSYSGSSAFRYIYETEKAAAGYNDYLAGNAYEYFAESFSDLMLDMALAGDEGYEPAMAARPMTAEYIRRVAGMQENGGAA